MQRPRLLVPSALAAVTLVGFALHQVYLTRAGADAVYMDTLRLLWQLSEFHEGRLSLLELWGQHGGAHSGLLFQVLLATNASLFGLDALLANRITGVVIGLVALLLGTGYLQDLKTTKRRPPAVVPILVVVTATWLCFSLSGYELLTLDLGLGLWLKNLLIFALFIVHAQTLRSNGGLNLAKASALSVYGVLVLVFCAMGWSYAVVGAVIGVQVLHYVSKQKMPTLLEVMLPASLLLTQLALSLGKRFYFGQADESKAALVPDSLRQWLVSLASTFLNGETAARLEIHTALLVGLGGLLAVGFVIATAVRLRDRCASLMPVHLIAYASLCALSFVMARGALGDEAVMASRYHMDLFPGLVGVLWIASMPAQGAARLTKLASTVVVVGLACLSAWFQVRETSVEWAIAPYRKTAISAMNEALRAGVPNDAAAALLQSPIEDARNAAMVMRRERLAVFRDREPMRTVPKACPREWRTGDGWYAHEDGGTWSTANASFEVPACRCGYSVNIFIPATYPRRTATVTPEASSEPLATIALIPGRVSTLVIPVSSAPQRYLLEVSRTTVPASEGMGPDLRALGLYMGQPKTSCALGK